MKTGKHVHNRPRPDNDANLTFDVICGMEIVQREARFAYHHQGTTYYFCSGTCRQHFKDSPEYYIGRQKE